MPLMVQKKGAVVKTSPQATSQSVAATNNAFYPQLNGLRFVFVFMVLIHHWAPQAITEQYRIGWAGVDLFYVLSGFLIGEILILEKEATQNRGLSIRNFLIRRALRIFPLYYAAVLLYSAFVDDGGILIYNLTYTNNIVQAFHSTDIPQDFWHLWSLCVEEQFYLLFPLILFFVKKRFLPAILVFGIVFSLVGRVILVSNNRVSDFDPYVLMPFCLDSLFLGVGLAYLKTYNYPFLKKLLRNPLIVFSAVAASIVSIVALCYFNSVVGIYGFLRPLVSVAGFLVIGYSVIIGYRGFLKSFFENRYISMLGKISYGIYLLHPFVERLWYKTAGQNPVRNFFIDLQTPFISNRYVIDFFFLFVITVAISYLSFFYFEKRFLKLKTLFT